jgi:hypothetical protein
MSITTDQRARRDAERVRQRAFWRQISHTLRGTKSELMPFEAVKHLRPVAESYAGVEAIPVKQIIGSVDRYRDFDHYFLPRYGLPIERWIRVRRANLEGVELPAIQVYKVGEVYFVKDGHHRVSVAREVGQSYIDAEIIELKVSIPPNATDSLKDMIIKGEYAAFLEWTALAKLKPDHREILFTVPGRYDVLMDHIRTHQYFLGQTYHRAFGWHEAVASWYDTQYLPIVEAIERHQVLRRFPGRREADLYIWIIDHQHFLQQAGMTLSTEDAARDYTERFAPNPWWRWWRRFNHTIRRSLG